MSDIFLPVEGKDVAIIVSVNGAPQLIVDEITGFNADGVYTRIETQPLGTPGIKIDDTLNGWEGSFELAEARPVIQDVMNVVHAAQRARLPVQINIREAIFYRNGSFRQYTYPDVKLQTSSRNRRGEARSTTVNWKTGKDRIAA